MSQTLYLNCIWESNPVIFALQAVTFPLRQCSIFESDRKATILQPNEYKSFALPIELLSDLVTLWGIEPQSQG